MRRHRAARRRAGQTAPRAHTAAGSSPAGPRAETSPRQRFPSSVVCTQAATTAIDRPEPAAPPARIAAGACDIARAAQRSNAAAPRHFPRAVRRTAAARRTSAPAPRSCRPWRESADRSRPREPAPRSCSSRSSWTASRPNALSRSPLRSPARTSPTYSGVKIPGMLGQGSRERVATLYPLAHVLHRGTHFTAGDARRRIERLRERHADRQQ